MKSMPIVIATVSLLAAGSAFAKSCDEVKSDIAAKLDAKGVKGYTLDVVPADQVGDQKVVGSCESGAKKIVYKKG